jgi:hypothetical protein
MTTIHPMPTTTDCLGLRPLQRKLLVALIIGLIAGVWGLLSTAPAFAHDSQEELPVAAAALDGLVVDDLLCGPGNYRIEGTTLCTHGPDVAPDATAVTQLLTAAQVADQAILCEGDGVSGQRVQAMYVRPEHQADRYAQYGDLFRQVAFDADAIFDASAHATGGHRHLRFVTDADCQVDVLNVVIPAGAERTFQATLTALRSQGFTNPTRKYLLFVDADVYCGIATTANDDTPGLQNRSNAIPGYARVDISCWNGVAVVHELVHTLGGVQHSAPNASGGWHCVDERDIMCYSDAPYYPAVHYACPDSAFSTLLDCNHDDYFHTQPPSGSYLVTHWNVADSEFLIKALDDHPALPVLAVKTATPAVLAPSEAITLEVAGILTTTTIGGDSPVQRVEIYQNETLLAVMTEGVARYVWQAPAAGVYTLAIYVYDPHDQHQVLTPQTVTVSTTQQPEVEELAPSRSPLLLLPMILN